MPPATDEPSAAAEIRVGFSECFLHAFLSYFSPFTSEQIIRSLITTSCFRSFT